jgi:hypothetical protein
VRLFGSRFTDHALAQNRRAALKNKDGNRDTDGKRAE